MMTDRVTPIRSWADKTAEWLRGFLRHKKNRSAVPSRFDGLLVAIDKNDPHYEAAEAAVAAADEAILIAGNRVELILRFKRTVEAQEALGNYDSLSPEEYEKAEDLLARYQALTKERGQLLGQLAGFERALGFMAELEGEAEAAVPEIREAERRQRLFKQDMGYLAGERSELVYERERYAVGLRFIERFSLGLCVFFGLALSGLVFVYIAEGTDILLPIFTLVVLVVILGCLLFAFRRRIEFESQVNVKKQGRAVALMNKKTALYAHYTNFLNYEYQKYRVKNAAMLHNHLKEYQLYKHLTGRLDAIRNIISQTEVEIEAFFKARGLFPSGAFVAQFIHETDLTDKKETAARLRAERTRIENSLIVMGKRQDQLLELLDSLALTDDRVRLITEQYYAEAQKLVPETLEGQAAPQQPETNSGVPYNKASV